MPRVQWPIKRTLAKEQEEMINGRDVSIQIWSYKYKRSFFNPLRWIDRKYYWIRKIWIEEYRISTMENPELVTLEEQLEQTREAVREEQERIKEETNRVL